jgi:hypothetical protein
MERQIMAKQFSKDSQGLQANCAATATLRDSNIILTGLGSSPEYFEAWRDLQSIRIEQSVIPR